MTIKLIWTFAILLGGVVLAHTLATGTADAFTNWAAAIVVIAYPIDGFVDAVYEYFKQSEKGPR